MQVPQAREHEMTVIAAMMNSEKLYYESLPHLTSEHFSDAGLRYLFEKLTKTGMQTANSLKKDETDERYRNLIDVVDSSYSTEKEYDYSLEIVKETYNKRKLFMSLKKASNVFHESTFGEIVAIIEKDLHSFEYEDESIIDPYERAAVAYSEFLDELHNPDLAKGMQFSITTDKGKTIGLPSLDEALNGAYGGDLIMIAAKTGVGKTGFALNLARHFSFRQDYRGYYMNTEMRVKEMEARLLAQLANVNANEIMYRRIEGTQQEREAKIDRITAAYDWYKKSNLIMSRIPNLPLHKAKGLAKQVKSRYEKLDYIIVDYVGRMEIENSNMSTWDELYEITMQLKELAMTLDVPIFLLAQRNHEGNVEGAKKMMNECDAVLYFEPITENDKEYIDQYHNPAQADLINYKIIKQKVRRDDNPHPIYVLYDRPKNFITEVG